MSGKSTLASDLSKKYNCPWVSSDFIRSWMKSIVSKKDYPSLFNFENISAEEYYKKHSIEETIKQEEARDRDVFIGVENFILKNDEWDFFIIEGISIRPELISNIKIKNLKIIPIFLVDNNATRIREGLFSRGLWDEAKNYADWVKEIEEKYILKTNEMFTKECLKFGFKYFEIKNDRQETEKDIFKYLDKSFV